MDSTPAPNVADLMEEFTDEVSDRLAAFDAVSAEDMGTQLAAIAANWLSERVVRAAGGEVGLEEGEVSEEDQDAMIDGFTNSIMRRLQH